MNPGQVTKIIEEEKKKTGKFDRQKNFTVGDGDLGAAYNAFKRSVTITSINNGQIKLLYSMLQFLVNHWDYREVPKPRIVYAGAADGLNNVAVMTLLPFFTWDMWDPQTRIGAKGVKTSAFHQKLVALALDNGKIIGEDDDQPTVEELSEERKANSVYLINKYFTDDVARLYEGRNDVFFVSDIRNLNYDSGGKTEEANRSNERLVHSNMEEQMGWYNIIKPKSASMKFRLPWAFDFNTKHSLTYPYLSGLLYYQAFRSLTSTEMRLIPDGPGIVKEWNYPGIEAAIYYNNAITRTYRRFPHPVTGLAEDIGEKLGLTQDWDSTAFAMVVLDYINRFQKPVTPDINVVNAILEFLITSTNRQPNQLYHTRQQALSRR